MSIESDHQTIKQLFEQTGTFKVPTYQRGYAWEEDAVDDFIDDIESCLKHHENPSGQIENVDSVSNAHQHFFGGIVTAETSINEFEIVDGQQRMATFVILVKIIIDQLNEIIKKIDSTENNDEVEVDFLEYMIRQLTELYITKKIPKMLQYQSVPKLTLSNADNDFFQELIYCENLDIENYMESRINRESHRRILVAWKKIQKFVNRILKDKSLAEQTVLLQCLTENVLGGSITVIFMCTAVRTEAYNLFQILNNRGVQLTDGDFLRANTLEKLDIKKFESMHERLARHWDNILSYSPENIDKFLRWYYSSHIGKRPKSTKFATQFIDELLLKNVEIVTNSENVNIVSNEKDAKKILTETDNLECEFRILEMLIEGEWPYRPVSNAIMWERERLQLLVRQLKHTNAMPLLLAIYKLGEKTFAKTVLELEKFVFCYKTIGQRHAGKMTDVYLEHAIKIRNGKYNISSLFNEFNDLVIDDVPIGMFRENLLTHMKYKDRSGNGPLRYLLTTIESHWTDFKQVNKSDKSTIIDIQNTTIEHIYPQNSRSKNRELERLKDDIGNLTILGPNDNIKVANSTFDEKIEHFKISAFKMNNDLGKYDTWNRRSFDIRQNELIDRIVDIYYPK